MINLEKKEKTTEVAADIKKIVPPVEKIKCDEVLEGHLREYIITGNFGALRIELQAVEHMVCGVIARKENLEKARERMAGANYALGQTKAKGLIYSDSDMAYINAQIAAHAHNAAYYGARADVINSILGDVPGDRTGLAGMTL